MCDITSNFFCATFFPCLLSFCIHSIWCGIKAGFVVVAFFLFSCVQGSRSEPLFTTFHYLHCVCVPFEVSFNTTWWYFDLFLFYSPIEALPNVVSKSMGKDLESVGDCCWVFIGINRQTRYEQYVLNVYHNWFWK